MTDNELIAEFMGINFNSKEAYERWAPPICKKYGRYDTSWDWLIPVVEKIHFVAPVEVREINNESLSIFEFGSICIPIEDVYNAVVEFIKWHNSTKERPPNQTDNPGQPLC
jgi:hypothetical protein